MPKKILLDCDPGIDDALAIALAHGSDELEVLGLTSVAGNVDLDNTTNNALCLAEYYGLDAPVARGADRALLSHHVRAAHVHGANGLGNVVLPPATRSPVDEHAVDFIIDRLRSAPGEISLVAVGPLTNIALALRREPRIAEWAAEFVIMGGSFGRGNVTPAAEFNIGADPEAAAVVFGAPWRTAMVGLDLTLQARASEQVRARFSGLGRLERELISPILDFAAHTEPYRERGPAVHDVCAVARVLDPSLIITVPARVEVETAGRFTSGMTVVDFNAAAEQCNAEVATELNHEAFWDVVTAGFQKVAVGLA